MSSDYKTAFPKHGPLPETIEKALLEGILTDVTEASGRCPMLSSGKCYIEVDSADKSVRKDEYKCFLRFAVWKYNSANTEHDDLLWAFDEKERLLDAIQMMVAESKEETGNPDTAEDNGDIDWNSSPTVEKRAEKTRNGNHA